MVLESLVSRSWIQRHRSRSAILRLSRLECFKFQHSYKRWAVPVDPLQTLWKNGPGEAYLKLGLIWRPSMVKVSLEPATVYITRPSPGLHLFTGLPSHPEICLWWRSHLITEFRGMLSNNVTRNSAKCCPFMWHGILGDFENFEIPVVRWIRINNKWFRTPTTALNFS